MVSRLLKCLLSGGGLWGSISLTYLPRDDDSNDRVQGDHLYPLLSFCFIVVVLINLFSFLLGSLTLPPATLKKVPPLSFHNIQVHTNPIDFLHELSQLDVS